MQKICNSVSCNHWHIKRREMHKSSHGKVVSERRKTPFQRVFLTYPLSGAESPQIEMGEPASRIPDVFKEEFFFSFFLSRSPFPLFPSLLLGLGRGRGREDTTNTGTPSRSHLFAPGIVVPLCHGSEEKRSKKVGLERGQKGGRGEITGNMLEENKVERKSKEKGRDERSEGRYSRRATSLGR